MDFTESSDAFQFYNEALNNCYMDDIFEKFENTFDQSASPFSASTPCDSAYASSPDVIGSSNLNLNAATNGDRPFSNGFSADDIVDDFGGNYAPVDSRHFAAKQSANADFGCLNLKAGSPVIGRDNFKFDCLVNGDESFCQEGTFENCFDLKDTNSDSIKDIMDFYKICPELKFEDIISEAYSDNILQANSNEALQGVYKEENVFADSYLLDRLESVPGVHEGYSCPRDKRYTLTEALFAYPPLRNGTVILTDEEKRSLIQEGLKLPLSLPLVNQEAKLLKKIRRKIKNRMAAQESRRKQKDYLELVESKMEEIKVENIKLKEQLHIMEKNNLSLASQLESYQNIIRFSGLTKNKTCLMVLVFFFAIYIGSWSSDSFNIGYSRVLISTGDALGLSGLGPYLPRAEDKEKMRLIGPDMVEPSVDYYYQIQEEWQEAMEDLGKRVFDFKPNLPSSHSCIKNRISFFKYSNYDFFLSKKNQNIFNQSCLKNKARY